MEGSVSGGCVENAVAAEAMEVLRIGAPRLVDYGVTDDRAWAVGLACGGRLEVRIEPFTADVEEVLRGPDGRGARIVVVLDLESGERTRLDLSESSDGLPAEAVRAAGEALEADRSGTVEVEDRRLFLEVLSPPVRVVIIGAVHIGQHLAELVAALGWEVVVVDPRTRFATAERFPGVALVHEWPDGAFARLGLDRRTAVVTVTHDPKLDDPALTAAIESDAFYVGALGSRRTHASRVERLGAAGVTPEAIDRIRAPVGLDLGARTPPEIAASIVAEIVQTLRRGGA